MISILKIFLLIYFRHDKIIFIIEELLKNIFICSKFKIRSNHDANRIIR
jgi:hypothetical protein